jgi:transcriptional regulator with XRE-family HTH domain
MQAQNPANEQQIGVSLEAKIEVRYPMKRVLIMISIRISEIRQQKGLTQAEIAKYLKVTQQTYSSYETGKRQMNYETLCMLADYFEVSTDYLLGRQISKPSFLNDDERNVLSQYRVLDEHAKDAVKNTLEFEYTHIMKVKSSKKSAI